ncbi:transcription factor IIIB 90 kDa subunit isoform X1 [Neodiprion virginianus]|uniref:transcription factor IIIB 90 kDa subunit isoform X1 n=1 Tax=Neodiprion virginianus TaxID=2961670 RepID=UPI001EE70A91|nr:transcription factor IIIB 90 kDa subunit isoform X1 [Neodiprion virginianus]XP_046616474.1 transcription factor IIIB 90 kDa subunit isoform X1 [Neodiprion virginianus]
MSGSKCRNCGSTDIETDPARGDAVCTQCGSVLEDQLIVSETAFEETATGNIMLAQFVASDSAGGATSFGAAYHVSGKESREVTIQNARKGITNLCTQLRLNQHCVDTAVNFYKMALSRHLTRGRKQEHNHAACVYITCRTEGTAHMLIDISDVLQICVYELGRTYLRFTQALCINIPSMDPCLYIMRFANKLEFGEKSHEVSMTALRVVQRMKRDSIHSGRRPSGLCGAALLMAARLHEFNRSPGDIIKIVKVHESTLRKRLIEFGDTPSSALTLEEFMTVDLEEEQDPPAFKAARKKDRERLQKLEKMSNEFNELQSEIDKQLEEQKSGKARRKKDASNPEELDADRFIRESNLNIIQDCLTGMVESSGNAAEDHDDPPPIVDSGAVPRSSEYLAMGLGPDIASMGLASSLDDRSNAPKEKDVSIYENGSLEIDMSGIDDDELDSYIMSEKESRYKGTLWNKVNAEYLEQQKEKEEKRQKEKEEGKPEKKRRRTAPRKQKNQGPANSAGEAIEKMLQEKRISSKINYEVLKSLSTVIPAQTTGEQCNDSEILPVPASPSAQDSCQTFSPSRANKTPSVKVEESVGIQPRKFQGPKVNAKRARKMVQVGLPLTDTEIVTQDEPSKVEVALPSTPVGPELTSDAVGENEDYVDEEADVDAEADELSVGQMLGRYTGDDDYGYGYEDEDY